LLSTLRKTVEAMGGSLSLVAEFPDRAPVVLSGIAGDERESPWANSAVERIRARARNLKAGALDWDACKADRDAGRP
jgi:hypothetical protein